MGNCAASRLSFLSGHMQGLIDIAGNVVLGQAVGKVSPGMTSPALIFLSSYIATCFLHCFVGGVLFGACVHTPSNTKLWEKLMGKWRIWWQMKNWKTWAVDEPVAEQSGPVEMLVRILCSVAREVMRLAALWGPKVEWWWRTFWWLINMN